MAEIKPLAVCIIGPTASGKTDLAVELVQRRQCEIISVDSAMIYRGMDIGTAKPEPDVLALAPHRLIDICDPADTYSAARFREDALAAMSAIWAQGRTPLLVGGTMLYFKALLQGIADMPKADPAVRERLLAEAETEGWAALYARLQQADPVAAEKIHPHNRQRLLRALEVLSISGKPLGEHWQGQAQGTDYAPWLAQAPPELPFRVLQLGLIPSDRSWLHQRIAQRFHKMLQLGFVDEVRMLYQRGDLHPQLPSMRCVGYRQVWQYLQDVIDYQQMVDTGIAATRQLAKRQLTWLRKWSNVQVFETQDPVLLSKALKLFDEVAI